MPRSGFHDIESSLAGDLRKPIREHQSTLGHVGMRPDYAIKERQLSRAIHGTWAGSTPERSTGRTRSISLPTSDCRTWTSTLSSTGAQASRSSGRNSRAQLDAVRQKIHERRITYKQQFDTEMRDSRLMALDPYTARRYMARARITAAELRDFVVSDAFARVPVFELEACLMAKLFTAHGKRSIKPGDTTDLDAMACYLPYCHLYGTDRMTAELARSLDIPSRYDCELFDARKLGVRSLIDRLQCAIGSIEPVNVPYLSIFVAPTAEVKENSWKLFQKLGNKAKEAERDWGWWVELFGLNDGAMPSYRMRQVPDIPAPFYGLQEVLSRRCPAGISGEPLLELCRGLCRSSHLHEEIVVGSAWAKERGEDRYLKWPIHVR